MKLTRRDLQLDRMRRDLWAALPWLIAVSVALWTVVMVMAWGG